MARKVSGKLNKRISLAFQNAKKDLNQNKKIAIIITTTTHPFSERVKIFPLRHVENFVCLPLGIKNNESALDILKEFDGKVDTFFVDIENKLSNCYNLFSIFKKNISKSKLIPIKGNDFSADSAFAIMHFLLSDVSKRKICIVGTGNIGSKLALKLIESGARVYILNSSKESTKKITNAINAIKPKECPDKVIGISKSSFPKNFDCIIGFTRGIPVINKRMISCVKQNGYVIDGGLGTIHQSGLDEARKREINILKIDIRIGFQSNATLMLYTEKFLNQTFGFKKISNHKIIAGGYLGKKGDIVVDKISKPSKIIGIADGAGGVLDSKKHMKNVNAVKKILKI